MLFHADRMRRLRFFDFENFRMDHADHDLHCRAHGAGWVTGLYQIDFHAPSHLRTVGKANKNASEEEFARSTLKNYDRTKPMTKTCLQTHAAWRVRESRDIILA